MDVIDPKTAIDNELVALKREHEEIRSQISEGEERLKLIDAQIAVLRKVSGQDTFTVALTTFLQASAKILEPTITSEVKRVEGACVNGEPLGNNGARVQLRPTDAILQLLKQHPEGLTERQVVDALEDNVISTAKNKRRLIAAMLYQQKQANRVVKVGRLHKLAPKQKGGESN